MKTISRFGMILLLLSGLLAQAGESTLKVDLEMVAQIREEGFQRSQIADITSYMTDVLGARLTLSQDMKRAQAWAVEKMREVGLENITIESFMDYGVAWDNEYFSMHLLEPDYQPMVGFPLTHTPGTSGKLSCPVLIADIQVRADLEKLRGKLQGAAVLATPPVVYDLVRMAQATPRRSEEDLKQLEKDAIPRDRRRRTSPSPKNPNLLKAEEKIDFFKSEGVSAVLECRSGRPGLVRGFARPGTKEDKWSREASLASLPIIAVTPEHYNRMYRIRKRDLMVRVEIEIRNRIGEQIEKAKNVLGEIPGSDLADEVVMMGAHFDTWHASPNASDNTSGCAVALEAARILLAIGAKPRRTIRVAFWGGEEQGIHGSREYVHKHFGNPADPKIGVKPDYQKFSVYFNQDYGAGAFRGIWLQGNEHARRFFETWMLPLQDLGFTAISIQSVGSTDHVPFDRAGLPGFQFIQDRIPGTAGHTNLDFYDTLQEADLMKNAVIMAVLAYHAAMCDERIPRKKLPDKEDS
ncbi:MAG: M20/M25/M40 family metallo-hydrolase [Candidatus Aminicenantes bacterium]|nr:M20/M25/M40 family metallo-hydrolase [Candidatus Aminicenantes bacterium]